MNNRDILEDQFIKETEQFSFLDPNKLNPKYVEWLEKKLIQGQTLPIDSVSGSFSADKVKEAYDDGFSDSVGSKDFDIDNYR